MFSSKLLYGDFSCLKKKSKKPHKKNPKTKTPKTGPLHVTLAVISSFQIHPLKLYISQFLHRRGG